MIIPDIDTVATNQSSALPLTDDAWETALESLPSAERNNGKIPAFFFAQGSPNLLRDTTGDPLFSNMRSQDINGTLPRFLKKFGPALMDKYNPKGIVVFSAHWEEDEEVLVVSNYDENPLLMDYYGFEPWMYRVKFKSRGDPELSERIVNVLKAGGFKSRTLGKTEWRGHDGRRGASGIGFDHGVFVPFKFMFGDEFTSIPIVEVSQDGDLSPERNWEIGRAVGCLRSEGYLILSGGLTIHTFQDWSAWHEDSAAPPYLAFHKALLRALIVQDPTERKKALLSLTSHPAFRISHPREDHFTPLYVAAGAGDIGGPYVNIPLPTPFECFDPAASIGKARAIHERSTPNPKKCATLILSFDAFRANEVRTAAFSLNASMHRFLPLSPPGGASQHSSTLVLFVLTDHCISLDLIMFKLTRAFVVAAVLSSSVLCAPVPQDLGKPISAGVSIAYILQFIDITQYGLRLQQSADPSAHASSVFGTTAQDPNYQSRPTALCIVPDMAKDAGLSQGQEQLVVKQALELCPQAKTIAVSSKNPKRSRQVPNGGAPVPPPVREPQSGAPHAVRSVNDQPPNVGAPQPPLPKPVPAVPEPHVGRDLPPRPEPVPHFSPEPLPAAHQVASRSLPAPVPNPQVPPQPEPMHPHPVARTDAGKPPKDEQPPRPLPSPVPEAPRPHVARSKGQPQPEGQPQPVPQPELQPVPEAAPQPDAPHPRVARFEHSQVTRPNTELPPQSIPQPDGPLPVEH
ncbi:Extradiol ring-cleavage dioxygenase, class III enzyme, subunit B, partial [Rhizoctonia solani]